MPIYDLRCANSHVHEVIQSFTAPLPSCIECGAATMKLPSMFSVGGSAAASLPPPPERMPQTWKGTYAGDRDYVTSLRRTAEARQALEQRHPEIAGDRRPILAHEGAFESSPLRKGDDPGARPATPTHSHSHAPTPAPKTA